MHVGESSLELGKSADAGFDVEVNFVGLAGDTGKGPNLGGLCDAVPCKLLLEEGSCRTGRRMGKVEDSTVERKRDPRARAAGNHVAEDCSPVVVDGDVLPLKGGEGHLMGGHLGVLQSQAVEMFVVEAENYRWMIWSFSRGRLRQDFFLPGNAWTSGRWSVWMVNDAPSRRCLK